MFQDELKRQLAEKGIPMKNEKELDTQEIKAPVDLYYQNPSGKEYLVELEIHRADPSNNIAKIAYWLRCDNDEREIVVIHVLWNY